MQERAAKGLYPSVIYSDSLKPLSVLHSGLKHEWQPIFSTFCGKKKLKKIYIFAFLCNFLVRLLKHFLTNFKFYFAYKKLEKNPPSKVV